MFTSFKPLYDKVLVSRINPEEKTQGGLILPDDAQESPTRGIVIATGPGRLFPDGSVKPLCVAVDDTVFFGKYAGVEVEKNVLVLKEDEILGIIK